MGLRQAMKNLRELVSWQRFKPGTPQICQKRYHWNQFARLALSYGPKYYENLKELKTETL
jgi:hypothetical protein